MPVIEPEPNCVSRTTRTIFLGLIVRGIWELRSTGLGGNERHSITTLFTDDDENRRHLGPYMNTYLVYNGCHVALGCGITHGRVKPIPNAIRPEAIA